MQGTIDFIRCRGSRSTNEYPFISAGASVSSSFIHPVPNARFTEDLVQTITIEQFDNWSLYNMVHLYNDTVNCGYYWITGATRSSDVEGCINFVVTWNGPTSLSNMMTSSNLVTGNWYSAPYQPMNRNARVTPVTGQSVPQRFVGFEDGMPDWTDSKGNTHKMGWVTFTTTSTCNTFFGDGGDDAGTTKEYVYTRGGQSINPTEGGAVKKGEGTFVWENIHYTPYISADIGGYNIYGFPVMLEQFDAPSSATHVGIVCFSDVHTQKKDGTSYTTPATPFIRDAPTVWDVMSNQESLGFTAEDIVDVSFSFSCPFGYEFYTGTTKKSDEDTDWRYDIQTGEERPIIALRINPDTAICNGSAIVKPENSVVQACFRPNNDTTLPNFFICRGYTGAGSGEYRNFLTGNIPTEKSYTSDTLTIDNRYNQTVNIRDYNGVLGQEIPLDLFTVSGDDGTLTFETHIHCDYDGMFRHIIIGSGDTAMQYAFDEPKLPWTANAWQTYKAQSMNDDRNAVIANLGFSVAGTLMGGVAGGALMGAGTALAASTAASQTGKTVGIAMGPDGAIRATLGDPDRIGGNIAGQQLSGSIGQSLGTGMMGAVQQAYGQHVKERAIQRQPTQACNMGYGLNQVIISKEYPPGFIISYPRGTTDYVSQYIQRYGYPVQTIYTTALSIGYWQGIIYSSPSLSGPKLDEINNAFMQGVLYVEP